MSQKETTPPTKIKALCQIGLPEKLLASSTPSFPSSPLILTKAPKGYKLVNKKLVLNELEALNVKKIFQEFVETDISLTQLSKKHNMTTAGIKKLLQNSTYLGKIKFASQESQGHHPILIEKELFDRVQEKLKNL